ncbi:hypothetical protein Tco_1457496 [Tanacetum coccineum]
MESTVRNVLQKDPINLEQHESQKDVSEINEYKHKDILLKIMMASKSYEKHPAHKELYDALIQSLFVNEADIDKAAADADLSTQLKRKHDDQDEDLTTGSDQ